MQTAERCLVCSPKGEPKCRQIPGDAKHAEQRLFGIELLDWREACYERDREVEAPCYRTGGLVCPKRKGREMYSSCEGLRSYSPL